MAHSLQAFVCKYFENKSYSCKLSNLLRSHNEFEADNQSSFRIN